MGTGTNSLIQQPFIEAEYFEGDLLASVKRIDARFWDDNPELQNQFEMLINAYGE